jgi:hypothetical protein
MNCRPRCFPVLWMSLNWIAGKLKVLSVYSDSDRLSDPSRQGLLQSDSSMSKTPRTKIYKYTHIYIRKHTHVFVSTCVPGVPNLQQKNYRNKNVDVRHLQYVAEYRLITCCRNEEHGTLKLLFFRNNYGQENCHKNALNRNSVVPVILDTLRSVDPSRKMSGITYLKSKIPNC